MDEAHKMKRFLSYILTFIGGIIAAVYWIMGKRGGDGKTIPPVVYDHTEYKKPDNVPTADEWKKDRESVK